MVSQSLEEQELMMNGVVDGYTNLHAHVMGFIAPSHLYMNVLYAVRCVSEFAMQLSVSGCVIFFNVKHK